MKINKKAKMEWEYIAAVVLILLVVVVMLLMSGSIKNMIWDRAKEIIGNLLGKTGKP